jgi:hypothetical protein
MFKLLLLIVKMRIATVRTTTSSDIGSITERERDRQSGQDYDVIS